VTPLPVVFYTPETKLAFGGAMTILYRPRGSTISDRPSTFTPALVYTTRSQILFLLGGNHYWSRARNQLTPGISYRNFPDSFYGLGNDTDADGDEDFTDEGWVIYADYQRELRSRWRAGFGADFASSSITETQVGDKLESGAIPGSRGGNVVGLGLLLGWDDRDNVSFPRRGQYHQFSLRFHDDAWGSDFDFTLSSLDLRAYLPIGHDSALAVRTIAENASGTTPFQVLPDLGGDSLLRGYYAGRFRDSSLLAVQGELRLKVWKRVGAAVFAGAGQVASDVDRLGMDRFHFSTGVGLRVLLVSDERLHIRCDYGIGEDSSGLYFNLGEAF
jgi:outer membrane protein assembly factor BamA